MGVSAKGKRYAGLPRNGTVPLGGVVCEEYAIGCWGYALHGFVHIGAMRVGRLALVFCTDDSNAVGSSVDRSVLVEQ